MFKTGHCQTMHTDEMCFSLHLSYQIGIKKENRTPEVGVITFTLVAFFLVFTEVDSVSCHLYNSQQRSLQRIPTSWSVHKLFSKASDPSLITGIEVQYLYLGTLKCCQKVKALWIFERFLYQLQSKSNTHNTHTKKIQMFHLFYYSK